jgi:OFA family oxalate/formate antiporter-like MFS transporter
LELLFGQSRATISLTYAIALVSLTTGVLMGHRIYALFRPPVLAGAICSLGAVGALVAARADDIWQLWAGYSVLFGWANGLAYGYALQIAAQAVPNRRGSVMALVTASYGLGAALAPLVFSAALAKGGFAAAMLALATALIAVIPLSAGAFHWSGISFKSTAVADRAGFGSGLGQWGALWLGYGSGVAAGLMALGHASAIVKGAGLSAGFALAAPAVISLSGIPGSILGGWLADRLPFRGPLMGWPLISAFGLFGLAAVERGPAVLFCLVVIGMAYGALIVVYPAAIASLFGAVPAVKVYGRVFTAWGAAGLAAPWLAGYLFDRLGGYSLAMALAGGLSLLSVGVALRIERSGEPTAG